MARTAAKGAGDGDDDGFHLRAWEGSRLWYAVTGAAKMAGVRLSIEPAAVGAEEHMREQSKQRVFTEPNAAAARVLGTEVDGAREEWCEWADALATHGPGKVSVEAGLAKSDLVKAGKGSDVASLAVWAALRASGPPDEELSGGIRGFLEGMDGELVAEGGLRRKDGLKAEKYYITTAINYVNGQPHMGHAYESITSDVIARYHRVCGRDVLFVTGSDEHGQKIADTAEAQGETPQGLVDRNVEKFKRLNDMLEMAPDDYIRTTAMRHKGCCEWIFNRAMESGDIYLGEYEGWYNVRTESFVTEQEARELDYKDPMSGKPLTKMKEPSYFFAQSRYYERLLEHLRSNPEFVQPESRRNEIISRLETDGLFDLSISRTNISWGIPIPTDPKHVIYVWFDALTNYLTACDAHDESSPLSRFWPADVHIIGKDIVWFHSVIWPCMLWSAGLELPKTVFGHGFVLAADGQKMSKSLNNVIDPHDILSRYDADSFRYFTAKAGTYGSDVPFSEEGLATAHNAELTDTVGNLVHRATSLCAKFCSSCVPHSPPKPGCIDLDGVRSDMERNMRNFQLGNACESAMAAARAANRWLNDQQPWKASDQDERASIIRTVLEAIYCVAHVLHPFVPAASERIAAKLNSPMMPLFCLSSHLANLRPGTPVHVGEVLFSKVPDPGSPQAEQSQQQDQGKKKAESDKDKEPDISRLDLRVGRFAEVKQHESADKLLVERVELGNNDVRTIVSGLASSFSPAQLEGSLAVFLCNIKPVHMRGVTSEGMVLAATSDDGSSIELVRPPVGSQPGDKVQAQGYEGGAPDDVVKTDKKPFKAIASMMATNDSCLACFSSSPLYAPTGACSVHSLKNRPIS